MFNKPVSSRIGDFIKREQSENSNFWEKICKEAHILKNHN